MKPYTKIASILFGLIAAAHVARLIFGWAVTINGTPVPMWASIVAAVITGAMSVILCRGCCCKPAVVAA